MSPPNTTVREEPKDWLGRLIKGDVVFKTAWTQPAWGFIGQNQHFTLFLEVEWQPMELL